MNSVLRHIIAAFVFIAAAAILVLYCTGAFDIVFIERPASAVESTSETQTLPPTTTIGPNDNLQNVYNPEEIAGTLVTNADNGKTEPIPTEDMLAGMPSALSLISKGYKLTDSVFNKATHGVAKINFLSMTPRTFGEADNLSLYYFEGDSVLETYMGYIICKNGSEKLIYSANGDKYGLKLNEYLKPAYARDADLNPLFSYKNEYFHINADGFLEKSEYDPELAPGIVFDFPSYYGQSDIGLVPFYEDTEVIVPQVTETTKAPETSDKTETTKAPETTKEAETTKKPETIRPEETTKKPS